MEFFKLPVHDFLNKVDSAAPTPGGGTVSAAAVAFGIGLLRMVAQITVSKKKFQELAEAVKADYRDRFERLEDLKHEAINLADLDSEAFEKIMGAYRLAKETEEEKALREEAIRKATVTATEVPLKTARVGLAALETALPMFPYAAKSALSDFGVGALLLDAGIRGAVMNVKTNLIGFSDQSFKEACLKECGQILKRAEEIVSGLSRELAQHFG